MTIKEDLHRLVDELPKKELPVAKRYLEYLRNMGDPALRVMLEAPEDDEPSDDPEDEEDLEDEDDSEDEAESEPPDEPPEERSFDEPDADVSADAFFL